jgi:hypothetical protein
LLLILGDKIFTHKKYIQKVKLKRSTKEKKLTFFFGKNLNIYVISK